MEAVTESSFLKKTLLNFVNININNLQFHPLLLKVPDFMPPGDTTKPIFFFLTFTEGIKKEQWAIKISLL